MRFNRYVSLFYCLCFGLVACSNTTQPMQTSATVPVINPAINGTVPTPVFTPVPEGESLLNRLPKCEGIKILQEPIKFDWPNIEIYMKTYENGLWGYYSCEEPQADVAAFYRSQMPKPPSNAYEMNWVVIPEGTVGVFYDGLTYTILWIVPQSGNAQKTYLIVAQTTFPVGDVCLNDQFIL
jgi:hypothetical protein